MEQYTKEQLIEAQIQYNKNYLDDKLNFGNINEMTPDNLEQTAVEQIDYLLSLVI